MASMNSYIGRQIGNYRIVKEIPGGGFASVFLGQHIVFTDRPIVAIKLLHAHLASQEESDRFLQEARFLEKLKHPHILPIIDAGIQGGLPYLVAEYATKGSLRDRLLRQSPKLLLAEEIITILSQIGQALQYAHTMNIVHRDLKPENVLFNIKNEALLADFGIATVLETARTKHADVSGSPSYMAPEQFDGSCIAYELVTGRKPFIAANPSMEVMWYQHATVNPIPPTQLNSQLPKYIEQAILQATAKNRANRHTDVFAFISALHKSAKQWLDEGNAHYTAKHNTEALMAYEQAIQLDSNFALAYNGKGNVLWVLKRYEEALAYYERAIQLDPNNAMFQGNKGLVLQDLKRNEEALTAYERVIQLDLNFTDARHGKEKALAGLKEYEKVLGTERKENNNTGQVIYLSPEEELTNVWERLERIPTQRISLVVPAQTQMRSHVTWRLLHARARELNKEILVISSNRQIRSAVKAVGFKVADSLETPPSSRPRPGSRPGRTSLGGKTSARLRTPPARSLPNQQTNEPNVQQPDQ